VISKRLVLLVCVCMTAVLLWPGDAAAQWRRRPPVRTRVVIGAGFYRPYYYSPFYYRPFWFGFSPFYDPFFPGWYPVYGQYGYPGYYYRAWSSARIEVKPKEAQVYLDGYFVGIVDQFDGVFQRLDVPPGEHELTVYLPGYRSYHERILFRPGQSYHIRAALEPQPAGATAEPKPQPQPSAGRDPYSSADPYRQPPPPGDRGRTMPLPDRPGDRRAPPRAPESGAFGTLNLRVQPADAVVSIDGERWDSPEGGSRLVVQLSAGSHRVDVRKDGFKPYSTTVEIRAGEPQTLNVSLPPGD